MKGHIRPRGKGTWAIVLDLGKDGSGKRHQKWHTVKGTKRDAEREMTKLLNDLNTGTYVEPAKLTLREYLEKWLEDYARANVTAKTFERYAEIVHQNLVPALGHLQLSKIQPLHIQDYYSKALKKGRKDGKGGLSARTVLHHHRILHEALRQAVKWLLLGRNPADAVEPPRPPGIEMTALNEAEAHQLMEAARPTRLHVPVVLAITTGMRRGEILALRWQDIDMDAGTLAVRQSLEQTKAGLAFKQPKTNKGRRVVALPPLAIDTLRRHKAGQAKVRLAMGPAYEDQGLVCAQPNGQPWRPDGITSSFHNLVKAAGLPAIRFHDLRHTHASLLLRQGIHPKVVSERLGHSTISITLDTYSHVLPGMQQEAARKLDELLARAASHKIGRD